MLDGRIVRWAALGVRHAVAVGVGWRWGDRKDSGHVGEDRPGFVPFTWMERFAPVPLHGMEMLAGTPEELSDTTVLTVTSGVWAARKCCPRPYREP